MCAARDCLLRDHEIYRHRPNSDPEAAGRQLIEIASSVEAVQDGRIRIELINGPFLFDLNGPPAEYSAGLNLGN